MIQEKFAFHVGEIVKKDIAVVGLAVAGSWITNELYEYSDPDLILITNQKIAGRSNKSFVAVNCNPFSKELPKSELFGHKAGAFTGAVKKTKKDYLKKPTAALFF